jgi:hypothetical protein
MLGSTWKVDRRGIGPKGHVRTFVYNQNQTILCRSSRAERKIFQKYGVSITSEMAFTESLQLQKGYFLSSKKYKRYFFRSLNGIL